MMDKYPMKWYKFLIHFGLFAYAAIILLSAFSYIFGNVYFKYDPEHHEIINRNSELYAEYSILKTVDIIHGVALLIVAAFALLSRSALARRNENGPKTLYLLIGGEACFGAIHSVLQLIILGGDAPTEWYTVILTLAVFALILFLNRLYFERRSELFTD